MKAFKWFLALMSVVGIAGGTLFTIQPKQDTIEHLRRITVHLQGVAGQGSGTIINRNGRNYIITAHHVCEDNKINGAGYVPLIVKQIDDNGVIHTAEATVVKCDKGRDIAILLVKQKNYVRDGVHFSLKTPAIGQHVWHCGCPYGFDYFATVTDGLVSGRDRGIGGYLSDTISATIFGGCSGGGIFDDDGNEIGIVVRKTGETFGAMMPIRNIRDWVIKNHLEWMFDERLPDKIVGPIEE